MKVLATEGKIVSEQDMKLINIIFHTRVECMFDAYANFINTHFEQKYSFQWFYLRSL